MNEARPQDLTCTSCGAALRPRAKFCDECGARVGETPSHSRTSPGELRQATILFADVKGYTSMSESRSPDEVHEVMERVFAITDRNIVEQGGRVDKHIGDAVMGTFGIPVAHEDDAVRAVRAALGFQRELQLVSRSLEKEGLPPISLRVGINTGRVMVGTLSSGRGQESSIVGDTVNVASRLEAFCPPGRVLVARETYQHLRDQFRAEAKDPVAVKGKSEPVSVYVVHGEKPQHVFLSQPAILGKETRLVGRRQELEALVELFERSKANMTPHRVTVVGAPGVGKSRLLYEFLSHIADEGEDVVVLRGQGRLDYSETPYYLVRDALVGAMGGSSPASLRFDSWRSWLCERMGDVAGEVEEASLFLGQVLGVSSSGPSSVPFASDARAVFARAGRGLRRLLQQWSRRSPIILAFEDVHWADSASVALLAEALNGLEDSPVLVVAAARGEVSTVHPTWLPSMTSVIRLQPLSSEESQQLVGSLVASMKGAPTDLISSIARRSEGNPFFAEEMVRVVLDVDVSGGSGGFEPEPGVAASKVPTTIEGLLQARLDLLTEEERRVLRVGAVLGRTFWQGAVCEATGISARQASATLFSLEQRELVRQSYRSDIQGEREFVFTHDLLRDVAYQGLLVRERAVLHRQAADWLATAVKAQLKAWLALLGHHRERAGQAAEARTAYLEAAKAAVHQYALQEADELFQRYFRLLERPSTESVAARNEYGDKVLSLQGRIDEAATQQRIAWDEAKALDDIRLQAASARSLGVACTALGRPAEAREWYERALALVRDAGDREFEGVVLGFLGQLEHGEGRMDAALEVLQEALSIHREVGHRRHEGIVLSNLGNLHYVQGRLELARESYERALEVHREIGDRRSEGIALGNMGHLCRDDSPRKALALYTQAVGIGREVGDRLFEAAFLGNSGVLLHRLGEPDKARTLYREALRTTRQSGDRAAESVWLLNLGNLDVERCDFDAAEDWYQTGLEIRRAIGDRAGEGSILRSLGDSRKAQRRHQEAMQLYGQALEILREVGDRRSEGLALDHLADVLFELGELEQASPLLEQAQAIHKEVKNRWSEGVVLAQRGQLALFCDGETTVALRLATEAAEVLKEVGSEAELGFAFGTLGHARLADGNSADGEVRRLHQLAESSETGSDDKLGRIMDRLARAQGEFEAGGPLVCGYAPEDITPGQYRWLHDYRPEAIPAEVMARLDEDGTLSPESGQT